MESVMNAAIKVGMKAGMKGTVLKPRQTHGRTIKQKRSQLTYDRLISAGFKMLEEQELQAISIADLAKAAGYSVGAFYSRFRSKDEFFDALIAKHLESRANTQTMLFKTLSTDKLLPNIVTNVVNYYWENRKFWRAVIIRSVRDANFWEPIRQHGHRFQERFVKRLTKECQRDLTNNELTNISFAFQVLLGTINSTILNQDGPILMGNIRFIEELTRTFALVSGFESLVQTRRWA
jgi:AcrR family transcriptional regulator